MIKNKHQNNNKGIWNFIGIGIFVLVLIMVNIIKSNPDNDSFYLAGTGRWIFENGYIPTENVFAMHSGNKIFIQQWLCCITNYLFIDLFGDLVGRYLLVFITTIIFFYVYWKYVELFSTSKIYTFYTICLLAVMFCGIYTTRPYLPTITVLVAEAYLFERYNRGNLKVIALYIGAFFLCMFQANYQCASLPFFVIVALPYYFGFLLKKNTSKMKKELKDTLPALLFGVAGALINPKGIGVFTYSIQSLLGIKSLDFIEEMNSPTFSSVSGVYILLFVLILTWYLIGKNPPNKKNLSVSVIVLLIICLLMTMIYHRCFIMFSFLAAILLPNTFEYFDNKIGKRKLSWFCLQIFFVLCLCLSIKIMLLPTSGIHYEYDNHLPINYLDENGVDKNNTRIFTDFTIGSVYTWYGYHPYIDSRAEAYAPFSTGGDDIWGEYILLIDGKIDINNFIDKYDFDYFDCYIGSPIYVYLKSNPEEYRLIYESKRSAFYERIL